MKEKLPNGLNGALPPLLMQYSEIIERCFTGRQRNDKVDGADG
jgi:hypothetical protein